MNEEDAEASRAARRQELRLRVEGTAYRIRLVESDPDAYDAFYNVVANPMLWFIQHYLWDLSNAPDIRQNEIDAYEQGYMRREPGPRAGRARRDRGRRRTPS